MTEIATIRPPQTALALFVEEAAQVYEIAKALSNTSFVPAAMRGKPQEITGAILFGRELDMPPMTALQTINIIQGRPTLSANAMRGLALGAGVRFRLDEATETRCVMSAIPPGSNEWTTVTWTIDQARRLDLLKKDNWKSQPGVMLIARATSQLCRLVAANILIGAPYSTEEIVDLPTENPAPLPTERPKVVRRRPVPEYEAPDPAPVNETPDFTPSDNPVKEIGYDQADDEKRTGPEDPVERPDPLTPKTRMALLATCNDLGLKDRNARLAAVSKVLGREIHSVNTITEREARDVIDILGHKDDGWPPVAGVEAS